MPQVIIEQPGVPPITVPLAAEETSFGRSEDSDVVLVADEVSRNHARLCRRGDRTVLLDLKSLNGTYVNQQRIVERVLTHLDEIWFGSKCRVVYRDDTQFGRQAEDTPKANDSRIVQNVDKIRQEMDRVGDSMTMIGKVTPRPAEKVAQQQHTTVAQASPEEVVRMGRAYRRLSSLYEVGRVMASEFDLSHRLSKVLDLILDVMDADRGFVMLRDSETNSLNVKIAREMGQDLEASSPSMGIAGRAAIDGEPVFMPDRVTNQEFGSRESIIVGQIESAMGAPLKIEDRVLGSIYIDSRKASVRFTEEDLELFCSLATQSAMAIDNVNLHEQVVEAEKRRQSFGRFLPSAVVDLIMNDETNLELGGQKTTVTTVFCDIRGSSKLAEQLSPQELVSALNEHFTAMTEIIFKHHGTLDKYIGDEIMAIFGAPISSGDDVFDAVCASIEIQMLNEELNALRRHEGRAEITVGIGIDTGDVIAGYIGSPMRMDYTVVGDRVNTAKRFCDMAGPGQVVAGQDAYDAISERVNSRPIGTVMLKGKEEAVRAHEIVSIR